MVAGGSGAVARWSKAKRLEMAGRAFELDVTGLRHAQIAENLSCHYDTVGPLIREEGQRRQRERQDEITRSIEVYRATQRHAWARLRNIPMADQRLLDPETGETVFVSANRSDATGWINAIRNAQAEIDKITGAARAGREGVDNANINVSVNVAAQADAAAVEAERARVYEEFFADLDAQRARFDGQDPTGDKGEPVDTEGSIP